MQLYTTSFSKRLELAISKDILGNLKNAVLAKLQNELGGAELIMESLVGQEAN